MKTALARRGFLRLMSAAPFAGKAAAEHAAARLSGISGQGLVPGPVMYGSSGSTAGPVSSSDPSPEQVSRAMLIPGNRQRFIDMLWEEAYDVTYIDPDIAVHRSVSLAAKIAYQRQRNVQRRYERFTKGYPWSRINNFLSKFVGI
jgi:hypothetical protein